jgi:chromosome segregation ATPase
MVVNQDDPCAGILFHKNRSRNLPFIDKSGKMQSSDAPRAAPMTRIRKNSQVQNPRTTRLQAYFNRLLNQSYELESEFSKEKEAYAAKELDLSLLKSEKNKLEYELDKEKEARAYKELCMSRLDSEKKELKSQLGKERTAHHLTRNDLSRSKSHTASAYKERDKIKKSHDLLRTEKNELQNEVEMLEDEISTMQDEKDAILKKMAEQGSELEEAYTHMKYAMLRVKVRDNLGANICTHNTNEFPFRLRTSSLLHPR